MKSRTAERFRLIEKSATYAVLDLVRRLRAEGRSVLDLGGGEPDFATPRHISDAAVGAIGEGRTHYTASRGLPELLTAVAEKLGKENGLTVDPAVNLIATPSAKHALFIALTTILDPDDDLLVPTPSWVSYGAMARLVGARPVAVELRGDEGFRITREALEHGRTGRTKAILLNNPNNPTGRVLSRAEAEVVAAFAVEHDLLIVTDEIYEKIRFDGGEHISVASMPGCADRTITVNGFSKAYAMTGWRLGYVAAPADIAAEMLKVQQHTVGCAGSFVQHGGVVALTGDQEPVRAMTEEYRARRDLIVGGLNSLPGIRCAPPEGALYVFPDIRGTRFADSQAFTEWLLREAGVAVTPGSAFGPGGEGHIRLSFATSRDVLEEAIDRMAGVLR
ncbi:pyridoxal phosphate-dependent aminotransferase [Microbispora sp. RL4-1S]|uniref:Aminotransferase n=1 Tax=Microbispora oryzae TaxID=2806554 RepID=A0A940WIG3_9ACTN|nr:pyridoxal phosphate-dependent aminotransferase [Microbispora oryzae]MBP2705518.1 pyridoxal phosphate-dependent aminotransferase [Microbispora oryzae]